MKIFSTCALRVGLYPLYFKTLVMWNDSATDLPTLQSHEPPDRASYWEQLRNRGSKSIQKTTMKLSQVSVLLNVGHLVEVFCVILFASLFYYFLITNLDQSQEDARMINVSGRQRMLSQRLEYLTLTWLILQTNGSLGNISSILIDKELLLETRQATMDELYDAHIFMTVRKRSTFSQESEDFYFTDGFNDVFLQFLEGHGDLTEGNLLEYYTPFLESEAIYTSQYTTVRDPLNNAVKYFQNDSEKSDEDLKDTEFLLYILTVVVVVFIHLFMVYPIVRHVASKQLELQKAKRRAEDANNTKDLFLANISHEIRTPLNGILGILDMLKLTNLDSQQEELLDITVSSSENLLLLINQILDLSRLNAGKLELSYSKFQPIKIVKSVVSLFQSNADLKGLKLDWNTGELLEELVVFSDELRIQQILMNLMGNAIKFTKVGGVTLECMITSESSDSAYLNVEEHLKKDKSNGFPSFERRRVLIFRVIDSGVGIPIEKANALFNRFSQMDASITREHGGSGLGLAISRDLSNLLGGDLQYFPRTDQVGSIFELYVPVVICNPDHQSMIEDSLVSTDGETACLDPSQAHILIAEDNLVNQKVLNRILGVVGVLEKTVVGTGLQAVEFVERALENSTPLDVIFMDIQMPKMDGCQATERILRMYSSLPSRPYIVALTGNVFSTDLEKYTAIGFDRVLKKPVRLSDIQELFQSLPSKDVT